MKTIDDIKRSLELDGRGIKLLESSFIQASLNATFIHPVFGEWSAKPYKVIIKKATHPKEANLKRSTSNKAVRKDDTVSEKTKATNIKKYGVQHTGQVKEFIEKRKATCLIKYGVECALSSKEVRNKGKATKLKSHGDENYRNSEQIKKTCLERYGTENPASNKEVLTKILTTKEQRGLIVRPNGKSWQELALELGVPRTSLQEFVRLNPSSEAIDNFIAHRENGLSNIEAIFSTEMNVQKYTGGVLNYRPDFCINDIYINIDGLYWHSQKVDRDRKYHYAMRDVFEKNNLRILQFRADDIKYRMNIVKSMINNITGKTSTKVYARQCIIKDVDAFTANAFLNIHHMMGKSNSKFIGLYLGEDLISVMGFKVKKSILDIDRYASLINTNVVGGLSKLMSHLIHKLSNTINIIHYWVDLRYGNGKSLEKIGFSFCRDVQSWQWTDFDHTYHRTKCMASKEESQSERAKKLGLWQIYDAGQRLYVKKL